jgi:short-subunit dehydrogenase
MKLQNSVAIVTGASAGIGEAVARQLGQAGAKVVLAARSEAKIREIAAQVPGSLAVPTDMRKPEDIKLLVQKAHDTFGRVDILINNAGQGMRAPVESIDINDYRSIIELNVIGPLIAMQEVIPLMRKQGGGMILNVSGLVSKIYYPQIAAYASTKYALNCLSLTARQELEKDHIAVSIFLPKMTATDFGQNVKGETYESRAGRPGMTADTVEAVAKAILEQLQSGEAEVIRQ